MRQRPRDKRYRDGVDKGRMATQSIALPVKKDFKPNSQSPPRNAVIHSPEGDITILGYEDLPKQIKKHIEAKAKAKRQKINKNNCK